MFLLVVASAGGYVEFLTQYLLYLDW